MTDGEQGEVKHEGGGSEVEVQGRKKTRGKGGGEAFAVSERWQQTAS